MSDELINRAYNLFQGENDLELTITVSANSFLYRMVRNIVSALVKIGTGKLSLLELHKLFVAADRSAVKWQLAPACGLYLVNVNYDPDHLTKNILSNESVSLAGISPSIAFPDSR